MIGTIGMFGITGMLFECATQSQAAGGLGAALATTSGAPPASSIWWNLLISLFLLLFPLGVALLIPAVHGSDPNRWRTLQRWLIGITLAAMGGWIGLWLGTGTMLRSWWIMPIYPALLVTAIVVTNRKREDQALANESSAQAQGAARTASLTVRQSDNLGVAPWAWWLLAALALAGVAAVGARFFVAMDDQSAVIRAWSGMLMAVVGVGEVALFAWIVRRALPREPRPLDPHGAPELVEGYQRMARFRARGFFAFGGIMAVVMSAGGVMVAWIGADADGRALGLIGAAVGTTLGLVGGAFGTWCSVRQMRLQDRRVELTRASDACQPATGQ